MDATTTDMLDWVGRVTRANGRGLTKPVGYIMCDAHQARIRVDCEANPEFWVDLVLDRETVAAMLAAIDAEASYAKLRRELNGVN